MSNTDIVPYPHKDFCVHNVSPPCHLCNPIDKDAEITRLQQKVAQLEALAEKRKTFVESQLRINTLLNEEKDAALAECERLRQGIETIRRMVCGIGIVGAIDSHDVIRRSSVIDIIDAQLTKEQPT